MTAGLLIFQLTGLVATTFYICGSREPRPGGPIVAIATLLAHLQRRGVRWLDLGPGSSDLRLNRGVMLFKEGLGAVGHCRSQWTWSAAG